MTWSDGGPIDPQGDRPTPDEPTPDEPVPRPTKGEPDGGRPIPMDAPPAIGIDDWDN